MAWGRGSRMREKYWLEESEAVPSNCIFGKQNQCKELLNWRQRGCCLSSSLMAATLLESRGLGCYWKTQRSRHFIQIGRNTRSGYLPMGKLKEHSYNWKIKKEQKKHGLSSFLPRLTSWPEWHDQVPLFLTALAGSLSGSLVHTFIKAPP